MNTLPLPLAALLLSVGLGACMTAPAPEAGGAAAVGGVVSAGCRQGECSWRRLVRVEDVENRAEGRLRRMVARAGQSLHPDGNVPRRPPSSIRWEAADRTDYAFCSVRRPAYAFPGDDGRLTVHFLDFHALAGYQLASAGMYMRICHALDEVPEPGVLRTMGYVPGTRNEQIEDAEVDALTRF